MAEFTTTIAGAKHRQREIRKTLKWMSNGSVDFYLVAEPENPHDPNAIRVEVESGKGFGDTSLTIGYLPARIAARMKGRVDDLEVLDAEGREPDDEFDFWNVVLTIDDGGDDSSVSESERPHSGGRESTIDAPSVRSPQDVTKKLTAHKRWAATLFIAGVVGVVLVVTETVARDGPIGRILLVAPHLLFGGLIWYFVASMRGLWHRWKLRKGR